MSIPVNSIELITLNLNLKLYNLFSIYMRILYHFTQCIISIFKHINKYLKFQRLMNKQRNVIMVMDVRKNLFSAIGNNL